MTMMCQNLSWAISIMLRESYLCHGLTKTICLSSIQGLEELAQPLHNSSPAYNKLTQADQNPGTSSHLSSTYFSATRPCDEVKSGLPDPLGELS